MSAVSKAANGAPATPDPKISVVVPLYDEAENVPLLVGEILDALARSLPEAEVVLVDDGSSDSTWTEILAARAADRRVRGVRHQVNRGQSAALWTGIREARADLVVTLDGDRQNDPADLPQLLEGLKDCDFVCGVRTKRQDSQVRKVSSWVARMARRSVLGVDFRDTGCAFRVFRRACLNGVPPFNGWHRFLPVLVQAQGRRVKELPIHHRPRVAGRSKYGVWNRLGRGVLDLLAVAWLQRRMLRETPIQRTD